METKLSVLKRLYRVRFYLSAFHQFLGTLDSDDAYIFRLYKGIPCTTYTSDLICLVDKIITHYAEDLTLCVFNDIPLD